MLYYLAAYLKQFFGPARLLQSHALLLAGGTFFAAFFTWFFLPMLWKLLPQDRGKAILGKDGMKSAGKPTGTGLVVTLIALPVIVLFVPLAFWDAMCVVGFYAAMVFGYLDDQAKIPWSEGKKLVLDVIVSFAIATFIFLGHAETINGLVGPRMIAWLPFWKEMVFIPFWIYVPFAGMVILFTLNATNCSDGVDGLAGALTVTTLVILAVILYVVVGYRPVAHYFLIPVYSEAARWAILTMTVAGAFGGYLWYNAEPSKILMGDAGSRFLGVLVATASLMTGNPLLIIALSPVVLVNGGGGLVKLLLLRAAKKVGCQIDDGNVLKRIRFPLHDHCKKNLGWSNAQVLMRFMLLQLIIMPILLILLVKVR